MGQFILKNESSAGITGVSNLFLDCYMPGSNGEYIKVYLYLLRALQGNFTELSVAKIADALDHTESDVLRALKYWEKKKLLKLECDENNTLLGIYLLEVPSPDRESRPEDMPPKSVSESVPAKKSYSRAELTRFSGQAECRQLLFVCEQYLKKPLKPAEIETLLYFYDQLGFSADLIEYLVEYCVCKGSRSMHYIETVALAWAEAGITTVSQAKEHTTTYTRNTFAIMKAFGINDRNPVDPEVKYINKWLKEYDFTLEIVLEACKRTMERLHKPNFEYADRILKSWTEKKVHTLQDIRSLDQEHQKRSSRRPQASQARSTGFTNFEQRDYDFDELEKQLLQSQNQ